MFKESVSVVGHHCIIALGFVFECTYWYVEWLFAFGCYWWSRIVWRFYEQYSDFNKWNARGDRGDTFCPTNMSRWECGYWCIWCHVVHVSSLLWPRVLWLWCCSGHRFIGRSVKMASRHFVLWNSVGEVLQSGMLYTKGCAHGTEMHAPAHLYRM